MLPLLWIGDIRNHRHLGEGIANVMVQEGRFSSLGSQRGGAMEILRDYISERTTYNFDTIVPLSMGEKARSLRATR